METPTVVATREAEGVGMGGSAGGESAGSTGLNPVSSTPQNHCGSESARDEAITFNIIVDCQAAIASRLAPTGFCGV
ncbi:hypothetical protein FQZ97_1227860 [compost metagenome]